VRARLAGCRPWEGGHATGSRPPCAASAVVHQGVFHGSPACGWPLANLMMGQQLTGRCQLLVSLKGCCIHRSELTTT